MYGHDRLTQPMLRKTERQIRQERRVHAGLVGRGLRHHGGEVQGRAEEARARAASACSAPGNGRSGKAMPRSKLIKAGFRSNNLDPNARHCMASAVAGFMRTFGIDEPMGCYDDIEAADAFVLWGSNMAEMHPILWTRVDRPPALRAACARRRAVDLRAPLVRPRRHRHGVQAADRPLHPQRHRQPHHQDRPGQQGFRRQAHACSSAARPTSATGCAPNIRCRRRRPGAAKAGDATDMSFDEYAKFVSDYTLEKAAEMSGVPVEPPRGAGRALCRPEDQGRQLLDHGLQPAHPRRLVQQPRLQHPSADRKNLRARQQPVLAHRPALGLRHRARGRHLLASPAGRHGGDQQGASRHGRADLEAARRHHSRQARLSRGAAEPDAEGRPAQRLLGAGQQQPAGRRRTPTRRPIRAIAIPTTSSSCPTPIRR